MSKARKNRKKSEKKSKKSTLRFLSTTTRLLLKSFIKTFFNP